MVKLAKALFVTSLGLLNVAAIGFGVISIGVPIAYDNSDAISGFLHEKTFEIVEGEVDPNEDLEYFPSDFDSVAEVKENGMAVNKKVIEEGAVLLKNENGALPLHGDEIINGYSVSTASLVLAGTGSSGTNNDPGISFYDGLTEAGFEVNSELYQWYKSNFSTYGRVNLNGGNIGANFSIREAPWNSLPASAKSYADVGIFWLARTSGEGADMAINTGNKSDMNHGNYLEFNANERSVLAGMKEMKDAGDLDKIVVLVNSAAPLELDFLDDESYDIDAAMWVGTMGSAGIRGVASLLSGEKNPSGKLPDIYFRHHYMNPVYANFGGLNSGWTYGNGGITSDNKSNHYVVYQEGIYEGYRYAETRYEDDALGRPATGEFDYDEAIQFPFGFGLSYTDFSYRSFQVKAPDSLTDPDGVFELSVTVRNDGAIPGKAVAEFYLQKPYTDYDEDHGIEKSAVELVGFEKSKLLASGEEQTLKTTVSLRELGCYDADGAESYILEKGDYYFTLGRDSHDAINNILARKGVGGVGDSALSSLYRVANDDFALLNYAPTGEKIVNQFDNADINRYEGSGDNHVDYISRSDWEGTLKFGLDSSYNRIAGSAVALNATAQMKEEVKQSYINAVEDDEYLEYPDYDVQSRYSICDLRFDEIPYDDPRWEEVLDSLTFKETKELLNSGLRLTGSLEKVGKPLTKDHNGATGPVQTYGDDAANNRGIAVRNNDPDRGQYPTIYPGSGMIAATFNKDLSLEYGKAWGEDCLHAGYSGLYGPGLNIHRGAYNGRFFEYFSEDPVLSGQSCTYLCDGLKSKGVYAYLKHFALNDQESYREGVCVWANEQTIREIYLKPYQIVMEAKAATSVMTGFNRIGVLWTSNQGFIESVMRKEWGSHGISVTDWWTGSYMNLAGAIYNGTDIPDGTRAMSDSLWQSYETSHPKFAWAMRESAHHILYTVAHSNAMNFISSNTKMVALTPKWMPMLDGIQKGINIAFYITIGLFAAASAFYFIASRKKES